MQDCKLDVRFVSTAASNYGLPVWGVARKSASAVSAVTSDPFVAGRYFKYQSYKSDRHGCDSAIFNNIIFVCHRPTSTQS